MTTTASASVNNDECLRQIAFELLQTDEDFEYEEKVLRSPYDLKSWLQYIQHKQLSLMTSSSSNLTFSYNAINYLYERALHALPHCYKLWFNYLQVRIQQVQNISLRNKNVWDSVNTCFERSLVTMHKMPRIWLEYIKFLARQSAVTKIRTVCDRALLSLPVSQHHLIWDVYIKMAKRRDLFPAASAIKIFKRYLIKQPKFVEDYIDYLIEVGAYNEAAVHLLECINDATWASSRKVEDKIRTKHEMWKQLCDIISKYPDDIVSVNVELVLRSGIRSYPSEIADLWCALAAYYVNMGQFDKSFDIYEEGMENVCTVRDWNQIFDAYVSVCDEIVAAKMSAMEENQESDEDQLFTASDDLEMYIAKYEYLMERRPYLSNSVKLRQNPHNVHEWHKRTKLFATVLPNDKKKNQTKDVSQSGLSNILRSDEMVVKTFTEAVKSVDPFQAVGKAFTLWTSFARFYETRYRDIESARKIFEKAVLTKQPSIDDLASIWCEYVEMELRHRNWFEAKALLERATGQPSRQELETMDFVQGRLHRSVKLWSLYVDLEESLSAQVGDISSVVAVYEKMIDLKVATPRLVLNYAEFLQEKKHYEESFKAYERGINLFHYPQVYHLWIMYLTKFVQRYKGAKLERTRDLFEQAVATVPPEFARNLYLLYGQLEENYGLARHAMNVYERAAKAVQDTDMYDMYLVYISRAAQYYGISKTRDIYERAIQALPSNKNIRDMCLKYSDLERKLGEIDRARAIFAYAAKFCDPRVDKDFWDIWTSFEKSNGNIDTFKEMLRIKRSVEASNSAVNIMTSSMLAAQQERERREHESQQLLLKRKREEAGGSVTARDIEALEKRQHAENPDEIAI